MDGYSLNNNGVPRAIEVAEPVVNSVGIKAFKKIILFLAFCFTCEYGVCQFDTTKISLDSAKKVLESKSIEEVFEAAEKQVDALSYDMQEFNLDRIHPHLRIIYDHFEIMRVWCQRLPEEERKKPLSKIEKLQKKTEMVHQYSDAGEMIMSEANLARLVASIPSTGDFFLKLKTQRENK
jgi:hypothetical protein